MRRANPSSPVYSGLRPDLDARAHVILAEGEGFAAVIDLFHHADAAFSGRTTTLLYTPGAANEGKTFLREMRTLGAIVVADADALLREAARCLDRATMGTRVYITGGSSFIGEAVLMAARYGISASSIMTERRGGNARVQCVHCKSIAVNVATATVTCAGCNQELMVRDHFSRRLNAYMGVSCVAEEAR